MITSTQAVTDDANWILNVINVVWLREFRAGESSDWRPAKLEETKGLIKASGPVLFPSREQISYL